MPSEITAEKILNDLRTLARPEAVAAMQRFGMETSQALGIAVPVLREYARSYRNHHLLALDLWETGVHEARILASLLANPKLATEEQLERWVQDFNSWDICDQTCINLFRKTPWAYQKAYEWAEREPEFVRRAGFVMMAALAIHDKKAEDATLAAFFPLIEKYAFDERNFVKKAVNWALRQIGKRNPDLKNLAIETATAISRQTSKSARWIAADALRELAKK